MENHKVDNCNKKNTNKVLVNTAEVTKQKCNGFSSLYQQNNFEEMIAEQMVCYPGQLWREKKNYRNYNLTQILNTF